MSEMLKSDEIKVVLLGASGVGKSSIVLRFVTGDFKNDPEATLGAAFMAKMLVHNGKSAKFQIWDTAGQEKYQSLAPMYYRDSKVAVIVYDVTSIDSFKAVQNWVAELREKGPGEIILFIVGNKIDLLNSDDPRYGDSVEISEASAYAKSLGAHFKLISAKENKGIKDLFIKIFEECQKEPCIQKDRVSMLSNKSKDQADRSGTGGCC